MFKMRRISEIILLIYLTSAAVRDIKSKTVALYPALIMAGAGVLRRLIPAFCVDTLLSCFTGTLPGIFLLTVAWITRQEVGYGDGIVLLIIGLYLGFSAGTGIFLTALLLLAPVSLFYIIFRKAGRRKKLPFIPFLLAGYILWLTFNLF